MFLLSQLKVKITLDNLLIREKEKASSLKNDLTFSFYKNYIL